MEGAAPVAEDSLFDETWDVAIVGGALTGAATALELLRRDPKLRVVVVESNAVHKRRVGESTVEVSSFFLSRVLGLSGELNRNHIAKQGLRFWFANDQARSFADCSEVGPKFNVLFPGYQIDRSRLDEAALRKAVERGARLLRPAKAVGYQLEAGGIQTLEIETADGRKALRARWLIDASGVRAMVGRGEGWIRANEAHPVAAVWSRWKGVTDWEDESLRAEAPEWAAAIYGVRNNATNHLMGRGWWAWWIPLKDGDVSIGVVYDQRLYELGPGEGLADRLGAHLRSHPMGERLLRGATPVKGDVFFRRNLAYSSERYAGDGFALVGDAAGFIDPFYSPGLDWICYGVMATSKLVAEALAKGSARPEALKEHNDRFAASYRRWFAAIYQDKYFYMGDYELMLMAFRLDLGFYYLGVVRRPFLLGMESLEVPSFGQSEARLPARFIAFYNRRLAAIARRRLLDGRWGRGNAGRRFRFFSYRLNWTLFARMAWALGCYAGLECRELLAGGLAALRRPSTPPALEEGALKR